MQSGATTPQQYLAELPDDKRDVVASLRELVLANLPKGYVETMKGMLLYEVPLSITGKTYNGKPLMYAAIGAQKNHISLYLCALYCNDNLKVEFEANYSASGKKLDMGKSCLRIKKMDQVDPAAIAQAIAAVPMEEFVKASAR
jgi:hypothetical protein